MTVSVTTSKRFVFFIDVFLLLVIQVLQGTALNYYIAKLFTEYFTVYFFFVLDFLCLFVLMGTSFIAYKYYTREEKHYTNRRKPTNYLNKLFPPSRFGTLPLSCVSWAIYVLILIGKISIIFKAGSITVMFHGHKFGAGLLEVLIGVSCLIFLLLVETHNWNKMNTNCYTYVMLVYKKTGIEIFDSVEMFSLLMEDTHITGTPESVIFLLICVNLVLPVISLHALSLSNFGETGKIHRPMLMAIVHNVLRLSLVDIPFLIARMISWLVYQDDASMFMMKNFFYIILSTRELYVDCFHYYYMRKFGKSCCEEKRQQDNFTEIPLSDDNDPETKEEIVVDCSDEKSVVKIPTAKQPIDSVVAL